MTSPPDPAPAVAAGSATDAIRFPRILQVCPNDHPPFRDICDVYAAAGASLGCAVDTVYLTDLAAQGRSASIAAGLRSHIAAGPEPLLAICHRYRAYRTLRATGLKLPRVVTIAHEFGFFERLQRRLERRLFARNILFAGVSPAVQAELAATVPGALCLPNGIDIDSLNATLLSREAAQAELGIVQGSFTIGLLGRLVEKKRPLLAIDALAALQTDLPGARLLVIGDGELRAVMEARAAGLPVDFCGFVPDARRLLKGLDALLLVSKDIEAFGMVALEAMVAGVPVVAGPSPGPRSVLGEIGFYFDRAEPVAIAQALQAVHQAASSADAGLDAQLQQGIERARREFSVAAVARRLDDLFFQGVPPGR
ncbi:MAG: glycosyltransferase family 4 protein [Pseudomonadales bacterium]|nr:glycosyltransferase family 4 protein [Pseudomonadales bacterium]